MAALQFLSRWCGCALLSRFVSAFRQHSGITLWLRLRNFLASSGAVVTSGLSLTLFQYPSIFNALGVACDYTLAVVSFVAVAGIEPALILIISAHTNALRGSCALFRSVPVAPFTGFHSQPYLKW